MTERTVAVRLRAEVAGYMAGFGAAQKRTTDFASQVAKDAAKHEQAWRRVGTGAVVAGGLIVAGVGAAVAAFVSFDKEMSAVGAAADANGRQLAMLRDVAMQAGKDTKFSATQAAQGEEELVKAGVSVQAVVNGGLSGALNLAAAGNLDVADAAGTAATAMTQFKLSGKDVPHIADLLAAGANKAQGEVADMSYALKQSGLVASQFGLSIDETVGTLTAFASAGLLGSDAGTSFRTMLLRLANPSQTAAAEMDLLGISAYDAQGKFVGIAGLAEQLRVKLSKLTPEQRNAALAIIFGSDAIRAANVLYANGAKGIENWTKQVNQAGYAQDLAGKKMDNLAGDLEQLRGSIETALIEQGSKANVVMRGTVQSVTDVVNAYLGLPGPAQTAVLVLTASAGAVTLFGGAAILAVPKVVALNAALAEMGVSGVAAAKGVGRAGLAVGVLGAAVVGLDLASDKLRDWIGDTSKDGPQAARALEQIARSGQVTVGTMGDLGAHATSLHDALHGVFDRSVFENIAAGFNQIGSLGGVLPWGDDQVDAARRFFSSVDAGLVQLVQSGHVEQARQAFDVIADEAKKQGVTVDQLKDKLPQYGAAVDGVGQAQAALGDAVSGTNGPLQTQADLLEQEVKALQALGQIVVDATKAEIDYQAAVDDATKSVADNGAKLAVQHGQLVVNSEAQRALADKLIAVRDGAHGVTESMIEQGKPADEVIAKARTQYRRFVDLAVQMGLTRAQARNLAASYGLLPADVKTTFETPGMDGAISRVATLRAMLINLPNHKDVAIRVTQYGDVRQGLVRGHRAGGGDVEAGSTYVVGERGPELFTSPASGRIVPHDQLGRLVPFDPGRHAPAGAGIDYGRLAAALARHAKGMSVTVPTQIIGDPSALQTARWAHDSAHALRSALG